MFLFKPKPKNQRKSAHLKTVKKTNETQKISENQQEQLYPHDEQSRKKLKQTKNEKNCCIKTPRKAPTKK